MEPSSPPLHTVGTSPHRLDAREKVTGRATFITDLRVPGMVYTKLWRSPLPHAYLRAIVTTAADVVAVPSATKPCPLPVPSVAPGGAVRIAKMNSP